MIDYFEIYMTRYKTTEEISTTDELKASSLKNTQALKKPQKNWT